MLIAPPTHLTQRMFYSSESPSNILVKRPSTPGASGDRWHALPANGTDALLAVTYTGAVDDYIHRFDGDPAQLTVISMGETPRSTASDVAPAAAQSGQATHRSVEDPGDLTGLSIELNTVLDSWAAAADAHRVLWFDSVTDLLEQTDLATAFRFLHLTTRRLVDVDATGYYHLTADAYDEQTVATLSPLFDTVQDPSSVIGD